MNSEKIKCRMKEIAIRQKAAAQILGITQPALSAKLSGKRPMLLEEADVLRKLLLISDKDFAEYFLSGQQKTAEVQETSTAID